MRGKQQRGGDVGRARRIIPAHAGQTSLRCTTRTRNTDHPRACGANAHQRGGQHAQTGSSPRMRGKRHVNVGCFKIARIIPAHAGQTASGSPSSHHMPDHPRACGANSAISANHVPLFGSSPRMRGKHLNEPLHVTNVRIIPAHAGQTPDELVWLTLPTDHPRACGANPVLSFIIPSVIGSSPRMRGKPAFRVDVAAGGRIIPAHAGQTRSCPRR